MSRSRNWCFTLNNYLPDEEQAVQQIDCKYIIYGRETGEETWTNHLQGYIVFTTMKSLAQLKKLIPRAHLEPAKGTAEQNIQYCSKQDANPFVKGQQPISKKQQGENEKERWKKIIQQAREGTLEEEDPKMYFCHKRTADALRSECLPPALEKEVVVFWGPTGTGKSRDAWTQAGLDAYPKDPRSKFWDGYRGEKFVVVDEFRGGIDIAHMLRWLDRYPVRVEVKGSSRPLLMEKIWITSNLHPKDWYAELDEETKNALMRRLKIVHYGGYSEITNK